MQLKISPVAIAQVQNRMREANVPISDQPYVMTISLARLLAFQLPLTQTDNDPFSYFNSNYYADVERAAGELNESFVVNIADVVELARRIWVFRYRLAYDANHPSVSQLTDVLIRCGSPEFTRKTPEEFIKYSDHVSSADQVFKPFVVSMQWRN